MRLIASTRSVLAAGFVVTAVAFVPGSFDAAQAAPNPLRASGITRPLDNEKDVNIRRGPFFELRVNSMDVAGETRKISCFQYRCADLVDGQAPHTYQLVRHALPDADLDLADCDEILRRGFRGRDVRFHGRMHTTRWIRDRGPGGTPIGGFVGEMQVRAHLSGPTPTSPEIEFGLVRIGLIGTTGLRPANANNPTDVAPDHSRCRNPLHDEGYYQGYYEKKGLRILDRLLNDGDTTHRRLLKVLSGGVFAGTFEGQLAVAATDLREFNYCRLTRGEWNFDGLFAHRCRPRPTRDDPVAADAMDVGSVSRDPEDLE